MPVTFLTNEDKTIIDQSIAQLSEEIAQVNGDGTPHQQLVTDGSGVAKWEDKPFGEKMEEVVVVEKMTFTPETGGVRFSHPFYEINVGQIYGVILDGERYDVEAQNTGTPVISVSNEVFRLQVGYGEAALNIRATQIADSGFVGVEHTIEILTTEESVKTIDPKYLPTGGFLVTFAYDTQTNGFTCDKSYDEVYDNFDRVEAILVTENAGLYDKQVSKCVQLNRAPDNMIFAFYDIYAPEGRTALRMTKDGTVEDAGM